MEELSKLQNIGKSIEEQLILVGIETVDDLKDVGAKAAGVKIQEIDDSTCINCLMALEGVVWGIKKAMLPDEIKSELKHFYQQNKK